MLQLQGLKARALLEDIGDGLHGVYVLDLYREFAKFEANRGDLNARCVVWHGRQTINFPTDLLKRPPGNCWSNVERVGVEYDRYNSRDRIGGWRGTAEGIKWQHSAKVVVLVLRIGEDRVLDLGGLQCLRSLTVEATRSTVIELGEMRNLGWLDLSRIRCGPSFQEIGLLSELQVLQVLRVHTHCAYNGLCNCTSGVSPPLELPNLDKCINLRVVVHCGCLKALPDPGRMTYLRKAGFQCESATEGPGLGSQLSALQELQ